MQFLNAPVGYALAVINKDWAAGLVSAGAVAGITSVLLVMLMSQPRIFFSMSRDQLLPAGRQQGAPAIPHALHHDDHHLRDRRAGRRLRRRFRVVGEMTSIGTLFAFVVVSRRGPGAARRSGPKRARPFRVPFGLGDSGAGRRVVRLPDGQPVGDDVGALPRVAGHRHAHLLVLRPHAQPAR